MGTTLQNGVYLPNEGERNCYAGLKTNWEILDQKVADVTALQQAVAGALHREIVASLPTTDIDSNTIYMILSGTSATENVYNEFMYVNNAWELIGTSATDLTNYYTKGDVDGLLLLKANASDLTSHTGDTTIHVTASDKSKWNTVALIKQLRLVNAQVGSATTIAFSNIDDTNGIKVGDKCMDLDGRMFEITAVDTTNQTVTVGTALIDLALDANVVHTNRNDDVSIPLNSTSADLGVTGGSTNITLLDKNGKKLSGLTLGNYGSSKLSYARLNIFDKDVNDNEIQDNLEYAYVSNNNNAYLRVGRDNFCTLGTISYRWKGVYAQSYYYGNDNVEFSTKFVTTDTAQTISGIKTFTDNIIAKKIVSNVSQLQINAKTNADSIAMIGGDSASEGGGVWVYGKNTSNKSMVTLQVYDTDNSAYHAVRLNMDGSLTPTVSNNGLGSSSYKWVSFNGLTPSSLSMPSYTLPRIDISGYITDLTGGNNNYTVPANGYVFVRSLNSTYIKLLDYPSGVCSCVCSQTADDIGTFIPVIANRICIISIKCSSIDRAYFIPCQGNI